MLLDGSIRTRSEPGCFVITGAATKRPRAGEASQGPHGDSGGNVMALEWRLVVDGRRGGKATRRHTAAAVLTGQVQVLVLVPDYGIRFCSNALIHTLCHIDQGVGNTFCEELSELNSVMQ